MTRMLSLQLERFGPLEIEASPGLSAAVLSTQRVPKGWDLSREQECQDTLTVLIAGIACREAGTHRGRQIVEYLLPGDLYDDALWQRQLIGQSVTTLTAAKLAKLSRARLMELARRLPRLARALQLRDVARHATTRQWMLSLGYRPALERTAHHLCELFTRLGSVGLTRGTFCELPLRQADMANALCLTPVHLNRALSELRRGGLATFAHRQLIIQNLAGLTALAGFEPDYLFAGCLPRQDDWHVQQVPAEPKLGTPLHHALTAPSRAHVANASNLPTQLPQGAP